MFCGQMSVGGLYSDFYSRLHLTSALLTNAIFVDFPE